jgi:hypothetical protein
MVVMTQPLIASAMSASNKNLAKRGRLPFKFYAPMPHRCQNSQSDAIADKFAD